MIMRGRKIVFTATLTIAWFCTVCSMGQDIQLSQYYNVAPLINPAFTGTAYSFRAAVNARVQWNQLDARFNTYVIAADYNWHKYNSGVGMYFVRDEQGQKAIRRDAIALQYAYSLNLTNKIQLRLALQSAFNQRAIVNGLSFPSQFTGNGFDRGLPIPGQEALNNVNFLDFSAGSLLFAHQFWMGVSVLHLNRPNQSFIDEMDRIDRRYSFIAGYTFVLQEIPTMRYLSKYNIEQFTLTPTFRYNSQGKSDQLDIGLYAIYSPVMLGLWYRGIPIKEALGNEANNESIIILFGFRFGQYSISYSNDIVISPLRGVSGAAHELNLLLQLPSKKKRKKTTKKLPCPSFFNFFK